MWNIIIKRMPVFATGILFILSQNAIAQTNPAFNPSLNRVSSVNKNWQPGGIFHGESTEKELLSVRTEYTKKFDKGNGIVDVIFGGPFHYFDNNGAWQDINLDIKPLNSGSYVYGNNENKFMSQFTQKPEGGVNMEYKNRSIQFGITPSISSLNWSPAVSANQNLLVDENRITYKNLYTDIDLSYGLTTNAILHKLTFNNKLVFEGIQSNQTVRVEETVELPKNAVLADENGSISNGRKIKGNLFVIVDNDTLYTIHTALAWDAAFTGNILEFGSGSDLPNGVIDIETSVEFIQPYKFKLIASIPAKWLLATDRIYPVVFDPTVGVGNQTSFSSSYRYPFNTCRQQRVSQILFLKNDINAGNINTTGTITQVEFYQNTNNPIANNNVRLQMQEVAWNEMTTPTLTSSGFTNCYGPTNQNFTTGGTNSWRPLILTTPFTYTNTKNLLIEVSFNNSPNNTSGCSCTNTGPGGYWGWYNSPYAGHRWAYSNSAAPPPSGGDCEYNNSPERNPAYGYFIPATRITINTTGGCTPISITSHPSSQTVSAPAQAQFSVAVSGTTPSYLWEMSTNGGAFWSNVPTGGPYTGNTSNQLTINPTNATMNGYRYRCKVSNTCTTPSPVTSNTGVLTINAPGCTTVLTPASSPSIPAVGGNGSFAINVTPNTCSWSATETLTWVTITSPLSGTNDATLTYTVAANTGTARSGIISVNGQNYTINQLGAAAPTTYIISGRVIENGSQPLPGVTISTTPAQGTAVTDAQGYYTLTVPLAYTGTVKPTLAPYNFTPLTRNVSSTNYSGKDFDAMGVGITIINSVIPPWQREADDYNGSVTVQIGNTTSNSWHLEADVYNASNNHVGNVRFPSTTNLTYNFSTQSAAGQLLKNLSLNTRTVKYAAVFDSNTTVQAYPGASTDIIEKKWDNKNYVFYNSGGNQIMIPLKYLSNCISTTITFSRVSNVSNSSNKIVNVPTVQLGNQRYFILNNVNSLIRDVSPGVFTYTINYNPSGFYQESGSFDLTKIGNVHNSNISSNNIVVLIGGIRNNIEKDIFDLPTFYSPQLNSSWSIANDLSLKYNINTWYIAQSNMNSTQKNAYDLGIALEEIRKLCLSSGATSPSISVIAHSKGGLEMRLMLDKMGAPAASPVNFTLNPNNPFVNNSINGALKSLIFLGTPHHGSNFGYAIQNTPGGQDLIPNSQLINYINNGTNVPSIRVANITGYQISAYGNALIDVIGDGLVTLESSSQSINLTGQSLFRQFYLSEDYNPFGVENYLDYLLHTPNIISNLGNLNSLVEFVYTLSFHSKLHRSFRLNNPQNSCPSYSTIPFGSGPLCQLSVNPGTTSMLSKILAVINNTNIPSNCTNPSSLSCIASGQTWASVLSNASISKQRDSQLPALLVRSDENGNFHFQMNDSLKLGDNLIFSANGVDTLILPLDSNTVFRVDKFPIAFFKSTLPTAGIQYPKISLKNQELITHNPMLSIQVSGQNVNSYDIITNSDTGFRKLTLSDTTGGLLLDSGFNFIVVRFNGSIDSVVLSKIVYYIPNPIFTSATYSNTILASNKTIGAKVYLNNYYYKKINSLTSVLPVLLGKNYLDFYKLGYKKLHVDVNSATTIDLNLLQPISYSSLADSFIFNFNNHRNPQYWKTITVKNKSVTINKQVSVMQYDDPYLGMALQPQTRKFVFRKFLGTGAPASYKTAIALDQINTPDKDSVYMLYNDGGKWVKYQVNEPGITEYDPEVQKFQFDKLYIQGNERYDFALMQKQAPIMKDLDTIWHSGQTIVFPLSIFVKDPDSIKNDVTISSNDAKVVIRGNMVYVTAPINFTGNITYTLTGTHDFLDVSKTYFMKVIPPEVYVPTAFTPNRDGLNDVIRPIFLGKLISCHFTIFNRNGQKVYETMECTEGWNGRIRGAEQDPGAYVWMLSYQFEGEAMKQEKGTFVLLR